VFVKRITATRLVVDWNKFIRVSLNNVSTCRLSH